MKLQTAVGRFVLFVRSVGNRTRNTGLARTAGSLAFTTVLGLVPLATVAFSFVARFPVFQQWLDAFEAFLLQYTLPGSANEVVHRYVREFTEKAVGPDRRVDPLHRRRGGAGDRHGRARDQRALGHRREATVRAAAHGLRAWHHGGSCARRREHFGHHLARFADLAPMAPESTLSTLVVKPLPFVLSTLALAFLYLIAPDRRVPLANAFAGALPAALAFEAAKSGFAIYVKNVPTYEVVYGTLAALPVFLIWIYVCWLIVLAGAAITATLTLDAGAAVGSARRLCDRATKPSAARRAQQTSPTMSASRTRNIANSRTGSSLAESLPPRYIAGSFFAPEHPTVWSIVQAAGWPIWPLIFASVIALALIFERLWSLRQSVVAPPGLVDRVLVEYRQNGATPELINRTAAAGAARPDPRHGARQRQEPARGDQGGDRGSGARRHP